MNATALAIVPDSNIPDERPEIRRFMTADLSRHGAWFVPRMMKTYDLTEQVAVSWIKSFVSANEFMFLQQDNAVALAQLMPGYSLLPAQIVQERFVWVEDRNDKDQLEHAADFYLEMKLWGKRQDVERIIVCEDTDVPKAMIEARLGRIFDTKISHVRV